MAKAKELYKNRSKRCLQCRVEYSFFPYEELTTKFCSKSCSGRYNSTGRKQSEEAKKKISQANLGRIRSPEERKKISDTHKRIGKKPPLRTGVEPWNKGKKHPATAGERNNNWKGGSYKWARKQAKDRDNYTCQECGWRELEIMETDHIKPRSDFPKLEAKVDNLITLCPNCHRRRTNAYLRKKFKGKFLK